jgi:hypothetical protein
MTEETLRDIIQELLDRCRFGEEQRRSYEERIAKALWRDRTEVLETAAGESWIGGTDAESDPDARGGWCR